MSVQQSFMQFCNSILFCKPPKEFFICKFFLFWSGSMQSTKSSTPRILWKSCESWASFVIKSLSALQLNHFQPPEFLKCALGDTGKPRSYIDVQLNQCTIGYAMKIKKKKMFKSKHLVFAHFSTKTVDFFGIDGKIPMFCHKYFLKSKMWFFLVIFAKKLELLVW